MTVVEHNKTQEEIHAEIDELLAKKAGMLLNKGNAIEEHDGKQILKPRGMSPAVHARIAAEAAEEAAQMIEVPHVFENARPYDGAHALNLTLRRLYGMGGTGMTTHSFWGTERPQWPDVKVGVNETIQVPWGRFSFLPLGDQGTPAYLQTDVAFDPVFGPVFRLIITGPAWKAPTYHGFFKEVEETLRDHSIYRGKCFVAEDSGLNPNFFDPFKALPDPDVIVFNEDVQHDIDVVIGTIRSAKWQRHKKLPLDIHVLLSGGYGTGKSSLLTILAQHAMRSNWTTIQTPAKATLNDVANALRTAGLYASGLHDKPHTRRGALVLIEDVDQIAKRADDEDNRQLLDLFDGISVKNNEVMIVMTTNHPLKMHAGMKRPGRTDMAIEIGNLDVPGIRKLLAKKLGHVLEDDVDFEQVHAAMEGYPPAFIMGTFVGAHRAAVSRVVCAELDKGNEPELDVEVRLSTADLVAAARGLRPLWDQHQAGDVEERRGVEAGLIQTFDDYFENIRVDLASGALVKLDGQ